MQRSTDRIITTHVGSLPRPPDVIALLKRRDRDAVFDPAEFESTVVRAVNDVVAKQVTVGVDVVNDGETSKASYATYIQQRLTGFGQVDKSKWPVEKSPLPCGISRILCAAGSYLGAGIAAVACLCRAGRGQGPHSGRARYRSYESGGGGRGRQERLHERSIAGGPRFHPNFDYKDSADYRAAVGAAMREEYEAIANAGLYPAARLPRSRRRAG